MTPSNSKPSEVRRPHTKSRDGCLVCKKRRVKCDEGRPRCQNCAFAHRPCAYRQEPPRIASLFTSASPGSASGSGTASGPIGLVEVGDGSVDHSSFCAKGTFTSIHMSLFHHAHSHMAEFLGVCGDTRPLMDIAVSSLPTEPYVLDQLLAVSGLHFATRSSHATAAYSHETTERQRRALRSFSGLRNGVSDTNYLSALFFATLLGIHLLHDALAPSRQSLGEFVLPFVSYIRPHRGVRAVTDTYWNKILQSDLQPLLCITDMALAAEAEPAGDETNAPRNFLESLSDHPSPAVKACLTTLDWVQWVIDLAKLHPSRSDIAIQAIIAWPLVIPEEFITILHQHHPESFVVLAYYAAIIHKFRDYWAFSNAGSSLFKMIQDHVGSFWEEALTWPKMEFERN